uniref:Putative zinc metalloprotease NFIA_018760 n=1 Tax=Lygus hesperus TaxID=30085 RepID=A0A0A9W6N3_LYGHE
MVSTVVKRKLFYVGLFIMAHALYQAHSVRDTLQLLHHGGSGDVSALPFMHSMTVPVNTMRFFIALEILCGFVVTMIGFVMYKSFSPAKMCDHVSKLSYYQQMNTGIGFYHFNHRGKVTNVGEITSTVAKTDMVAAREGSSAANDGTSIGQEAVQKKQQ